MSGQFYLGWIMPDGARFHMQTAVSEEIAEKLRDRCAADLSGQQYFVIAEKDIETWKASI